MKFISFLFTLLSVIVLASAIFFIAYFLLPNLSEKYFNISYAKAKEEAIIRQGPIENLVQDLDSLLISKDYTDKERSVFFKALRNSKVKKVLAQASSSGKSDLNHALSNLAQAIKKIDENTEFEIDKKIRDILSDFDISSFYERTFSAMSRAYAYKMQKRNL